MSLSDMHYLVVAGVEKQLFYHALLDNDNWILERFVCLGSLHTVNALQSIVLVICPKIFLFMGILRLAKLWHTSERYIACKSRF